MTLTWTLRDRRRELSVHDDGNGCVRLEVDGELLEERTGELLDDLTLELGPVDDVEQTVRVHLGVRKQVRRVEMREKPADEDEARPLVVPFVPPPGTKARRRYDLQEAHPRLYAARHVAGSIGGILIGILGVGALVSAFLSQFVPRIDWSWLPDLPDISPPSSLRYIDPLYWLSRVLPDWDWFGWLPDLDLSWLQYVVPVLVAIAIAVGELDRRKKRLEREQRAEEGDADR
ncbi:hypothetical protein EHW97_05330 [Aeromicrobium camelliae]|uniref:Uncharacterized protein n=1 Tax=Aeromicrobium camelliae TaxID=1538144 RepID=A0A3N6X3I2_9ACTN|nr:hypothetical protein [Aeromicrobium camelliae]RQN08675.1 hypothetical protein EHW97_05330 [Aeromicrobium camelliae]